MIFKSTAVLPSSVTNMATHEDVKPWASSPRMKEKESLSPVQKSPAETDPRPSQSKKRLSPRSSLISGPTLLPSVPKLLVKRSSLKSATAIGSAIKPNMSLSITDASASSSNTVVTDHFSSTNAVSTDQEDEKSIKKTASRDKPLSRAKLADKPKVSPKAQRMEHPKDRPTDVSKRNHGDAHSVPRLPTAYESESISEDWTRSQGEMNEILIIDEEEIPRSAVGKRPLKKRVRNKVGDRPGAMLSHSKTRSNHQAHTLDSSRCKIIKKPSFNRVHKLTPRSSTQYRADLSWTSHEKMVA